MLKVEALKLALHHVMNSFNTQLYSQIHKKLAEALVRLTTPDIDGI